jgi:hypothetical protein
MLVLFAVSDGHYMKKWDSQITIVIQIVAVPEVLFGFAESVVNIRSSTHSQPKNPDSAIGHTDSATESPT